MFKLLVLDWNTFAVTFVKKLELKADVKTSQGLK